MAQDTQKDHPAHARAGAILDRLRQRGVVFVEIDSGAKPSFKVESELFTPAQGLSNAGDYLHIAKPNAAVSAR